jgi:hypothetical protein
MSRLINYNFMLILNLEYFKINRYKYIIIYKILNQLKIKIIDKLNKNFFIK